MIGLLAQFVIPLIFLAAAVGGRIAHSRRAERITTRQAAVAHIAVSPTPTPPATASPAGAPPVHGEMVVGSVVVGADYIRQIVGGLRGLIGGELKSYRPVLDQARAESTLRMLEQAARGDASAVVNVRFETSRISSQASEFLSYGTLVR